MACDWLVDHLDLHELFEGQNLSRVAGVDFLVDNIATTLQAHGKSRVSKLFRQANSAASLGDSIPHE